MFAQRLVEGAGCHADGGPIHTVSPSFINIELSIYIIDIWYIIILILLLHIISLIVIGRIGRVWGRLSGTCIHLTVTRDV
jgi:hypothetical protein